MPDDSYTQISAVVNMHEAPRFGHSSNMALLASTNEDEKSDYIRGVLAFAFFLFMLLFIWALILVCFKLLGKDRVGCAAGGDIIDMAEIKHDPKLKPIRRKILRRSWRIQGTFFIASIVLPIAIGLFLSKGLRDVVISLEEIEDINSDIDTLAHQASDIVHVLSQAQDNLNNANLTAIYKLDTHCPNLASSSLVGELGLRNISVVVKSAMVDLNKFMNDNVDYAQRGLEKVNQVTEQVEKTISWIYANDWRPKMCVTCLLVVNCFFWAGLLMTRNNCVFYPFKSLLIYLLVPAFCVMLVFLVIATCGIGVVSVMNADFCSGGAEPGSPEGTIQDIIIHKDDLMYQSFMYYISGCTTDDPLEFVAPYGPEFQDTFDAAEEILDNVKEYGGLDAVSAECGRDMAPFVGEVQILTDNMYNIKNGVKSALTLSSCSKISPILRRIFHGAACNDMVDAFTWMFAALVGISFLCMTMVTLRAALYNANMKAQKKEKDEEWEWEEYKQYMHQYYDNARKWKFHPDKKQSDDLDLPHAGSYETTLTSKPTDEEEEDEDYDQEEAYGRYIPDDAESWNDEDASVSTSLAFFTPTKMRTRAILDAIGMGGANHNKRRHNTTEFEPLSPPPPANPTIPKTPQKTIKTIQRTSLGQFA